LREALGRLSGKRPDGASVIRLETSFGGGNAICLLHPDPEGFSGLFLQVLDHGDGPTAWRQGDFPVELAVVEARRRSILACGGVVDPLQPSPINDGEPLSGRQKINVRNGRLACSGFGIGV